MGSGVSERHSSCKGMLSEPIGDLMKPLHCLRKWEIGMIWHVRFISWERYTSTRTIFQRRTHAEKSLALFREIGVPWSVNPLMTLARVAITQGKNAVANALYEEIWPIARTMHTKNLLVYCLMGFGEVVAAQEQVAWAVRLWSVAETLLETIQMPLPPLDQTLFDRFIAAARTQLGEAVFAGEWAEGRDMTLEQVLAAREPAAIPREVSPVPASTTTPASSVPLYPAGLTAREVEVLRLVAQGLTNAQIAEQLIISPYTVNAHMRSIYSKLDVTSRIAVMQYATRHHLI